VFFFNKALNTVHWKAAANRC